jgi:hypothetical protein
MLPLLRAQGGGHIVNISSLAGVLGLPFSGLYSASKFALEGMSESLRLEARRFGIRVVLIEPGDFRTQLAAVRRHTAGAQTNEAYREAFAKFKVQQDKDEAAAPTPEPVARLVAKVLDSPSPRLRYTVGMPAQRIVAPLKRVLPQRLFEALSFECSACREDGDGRVETGLSRPRLPSLLCTLQDHPCALHDNVSTGASTESRGAVMAAAACACTSIGDGALMHPCRRHLHAVGRPYQRPRRDDCAPSWMRT